MSIDFSPERWDRVRENYRKWWAGELDRPLIHLTLSGYEADRPEPDVPGHAFASFYDESVPPEAIVDRWNYDLSRQRFVGDAFPSLWPNFGPGVLAAFIGCELRNTPDSSWFSPPVERDIADLHFEFDPDARWFKRIEAVCRAAGKKWQGQVQVGMTDLGGNLDVLSSFRPSEKLLLDLYDHPDDVKRLTWEAHDMWWRYFEALDLALQPENPGYTGWTPIFSEGSSYMLQCDFAYMIGPEMFDEFVKPELAATCARLENPFYHLDGPGQIAHMDSLLAIPELKGIQWVPGEGQACVTQWPEVYRKIRDNGRLIQVYGMQDPMNYELLDVLAGQLGSARGIILVANADRAEEDKVRAFLDKYDCPS